MPRLTRKITKHLSVPLTGREEADLADLMAIWQDGQANVVRRAVREALAREKNESRMIALTKACGNAP